MSTFRRPCTNHGLSRTPDRCSEEEEKANPIRLIKRKEFSVVYVSRKHFLIITNFLCNISDTDRTVLYVLSNTNAFKL